MFIVKKKFIYMKKNLIEFYYNNIEYFGINMCSKLIFVREVM